MNLTKMIDTLSDMTKSVQEISYEYKKLLEIKEWALSQLHVSEGDAVTLKEGVIENTTGTGWLPYSEILCAGSTGTIYNLNLHKGIWCGDFKPDLCWSTSSYKNNRYPSDNKIFFMNLRFVRRRTKADKGLTLPPDLIYLELDKYKA